SSFGETIDLASGAAPTIQATEFSAPASRPAAASAPARDLPATMSGEEGPPSDATTDFGGEGGRDPEKTLPSPVIAPRMGAKDGPADYRILEELGRGGMGIVYKALDRRLNRLVPLKMIRGGGDADDIQIFRFKVEAEAVAALHHPNILQIYDIGEFNGSPY